MKAWRGVIALVVAVMAVVAPVVGDAAGAQTTADKNKVDQQIGATQAQVDTASADEERLLTQIDESTARKTALDAKVAAFDTQIGAVQSQLDAAQTKLTAVEAQQRAVQARLDDTRQQLDAAKAELSRQAIAAYTGQSEAANYASMLLGSSSIGDLASKRSYIRAVVGSQSDTIATTEHLRDQVSDLDKQVAASRDEAQGARDLVAGQKATLQVSRDAQATARSQVQAEIDQNDQLRAQVVARKDEFQAQLDTLEQQSAAIGETLRQRAAAQAAADAAASTSTTVAGSSGSGASSAPKAAAAPSKAPGRLLIPVAGAPITSPFGYRIHPIFGTSLLHTGIDYGADEGTPIRAAADGVVVSAGWIDGYGNATILDLGGGIAVLYGHQSAFKVSAGQKVTQGQTIGLVGCTGNCTGPHVHFEVRVNGNPVDPTGYI
ncbi:MAG TPA: peptidoglycan DD-metalloendopeptidase family protein [Acidimicrobiales bacterium]|nr:peptidoglycan DD-metalloendopeptidase family protein [Acidimicrobiales bacterium]